ncbi:hypothetical protein D3C85_1371330 [compost metagenome]
MRLVQQLIVVVLAVLDVGHSPVEFLHVQLEPIQAAPKAQVKFPALVPVVHEQGLFRCALCQQQCSLVASLLEVGGDLFGTFTVVLDEAPALMEIVPIRLTAVALRDLC